MWIQYLNSPERADTWVAVKLVADNLASKSKTFVHSWLNFTPQGWFG
jgi:hypothetical protein